MGLNRKAFTLLELAIVLVIIGLLVGGILVGQNMIDAQKARNVLQDARTYATTIQQFKDKYGSLPGDMPDAVRIWGRADGGTDLTQNCASPYTTASTDGITTCNGDGDGIINIDEGYRAWQQLKAAGMIAGSFTGIHGAGGDVDATGNVNVPKGAVRNSIFFLDSWGDQATNGTFFAGNYNNVIVATQNPTNWAPVFTTRDALAADTKIDDGRPGTGDIRSFGFQSTCATTSDPTTAYYNLATTAAGLGCSLLFMSSFEAKPKS